MKFKFIKKLIKIYKNWDKVEAAINDFQFYLDCNTDISADVCRGLNRIVVTGRYGNNDYVHMFEIKDKDFSYIVDILKDMQNKYGGVFRHIDAPFEVKGFLKGNCVFEKKIKETQ